MGLAGCSAQRSQSMTAQGAQERWPWVQGSCVLGKHGPLSSWGQAGPITDSLSPVTL